MPDLQSSDALATFVADVEYLRRQHADEHILAAAVAQRLTPLLRQPEWLTEAHRQPWDDHYRQHLLHVAPDGGFSIVALVWKPGQATPIHDHVCWCVVGVYQGEECETRYRLYQEGDDPFLIEAGRDTAVPGQTVALVPPAEDIHRVACIGDGLAISIHIYGADIGRLGTSINHRFDDLAIRPAASDAAPVNWRELARSGRDTDAILH